MEKDSIGNIIPDGFPKLPEGWINQPEMFQGQDGKTVFFGETWHQEPWLGGHTVFIIHGFGEHAGRYQHFPHYLQGVVNSVYGFDHRGHGRSGGLRGDAPDFSNLADDSAFALRRLDASLKKKFGTSKIHLFAHSMGGAVALQMLLNEKDLPILSASISAPFLALAYPAPFIKTMAATLIGKVWGTMQLSVGFNAPGLSRDPALVKAYTEDRLVHDKLTPRNFTSIARVQNEIKNSRDEIAYPIQFMIPKSDVICSADASIEFFGKMNAKNKVLKEYPDSYHEAFNDLDKETFFGDLKSWIKKNSKD